MYMSLSPALLKEFRPTILFLARFAGLYIAGSLLYGVFITYFEPEVDPITNIVTRQSAGIIHLLGWEADAHDYPGRSTTYILYQGKGIVSVYEGCNGLNVIIVFLAFVFSFGSRDKRAAWYLVAGIAVIHLANLARVVFLFFVVLKLPQYSYFIHKYLFTGFIYLIVFGLWLIWIKRYARV